MFAVGVSDTVFSCVVVFLEVSFKVLLTVFCESVFPTFSSVVMFSEFSFSEFAFSVLPTSAISFSKVSSFAVSAMFSDVLFYELEFPSQAKKQKQ